MRKLLIVTAAWLMATLAPGGEAAVTDGDTLRLDGERVRLWGIDAPETDQSCELEGRTVARCMADGADLGRLMVRMGWALDYRRYSDGHYAADQAEAEDQGRGLWSMDFEPPWNWRR